MNYKNLGSYIHKVIDDSCKMENRPNDVKYQFCIIEDNLIGVISSKYSRVERRIQNRLKNNLFKNFKLKFNEDFYILYNQIDVNFSIARWNIFGKFATIVSISKLNLLPPYVKNHEEGEILNSKHLEELFKLNGIDPKNKECWKNYSGNNEDWEKYLRDYKKIYSEEFNPNLIQEINIDENKNESI